MARIRAPVTSVTGAHVRRSMCKDVDVFACCATLRGQRQKERHLADHIFDGLRNLTGPIERL